MRSPDINGQPGIQSNIPDLSAYSLSQLPKLDSVAFRRSIRHAADRTAYIPVTASGSQGAKRVD